MDALAEFRDGMHAQGITYRDDPEARATYGRDRTTAWPAAAAGVAFPQSGAEVVAIVRLANQLRVALVPSGGRTGLSGAAMATAGEVVVSLERMNRILAFDAAARCQRVEAGVTIHALQQAASERGLFYPVDYASSGSAHVGGGIATNAGGIRVIRYGMTRAWVQGLQVVTGAGELLELNGSLLKNNSGYDMRQLFIGAEGTLGIVTEAVMRLTDPPPPQGVMLLALDDLARAIDAMQLARAALTLSACEFFCDTGLDHVLARIGGQPPLAARAPYYLLLEFDAPDDPDRAPGVFGACLEAGFVRDGVLSTSLAKSAALWRLRESLSETLAPLGPRKYDVAVPVGAVAAFVAELQAGLAARAAGIACVLWGHIGDGNLHVNLLPAPVMTRDTFRECLEPLSAWLAELLARHAGSVSAEHGIGLEKKDYLHYTRSPADIALMRGIRRLLDPNGIMNPGKLFD